MRDDILGTIMTVVFVLVTSAIIYFLWTTNAPLVLSIAATIVLGCTGLWAIVDVAKYWFRKIKKD